MAQKYSKEEAAMYIIDKIKVDQAGRITLTNFFNKNPLKEVGVAYNTDTHEIIVEPWSENSKFLHRKIDNKNRLCIKWLLKFINGNIYLTVDETGNRKLLVLNSPD